MSLAYRNIFITACFIYSAHAHAQPVFKSLRYEEDYAYLDSASRHNFYDNVKYIKLGRHAYASFGGELRTQAFIIHNEDWGDSGEGQDGYSLVRSLFHNDLQFHPKWRFFSQLQSSLAIGKRNVSPVDENKLDVHQLFIEYHTPEFTVRVGRQELQYGSSRLLSVRELPNNRQAFDAALLSYHKPSTRIDVFWGTYVFSEKGVFDDVPISDVKLWSLYGVHTIKPFAVDLYYIGLEKSTATFDFAMGEENRHSIGTRLWNNSGGYRFDFEGVFQFGRVGKQTVRAWTLSTHVSYRFSNLTTAPVVGLKAEVISGNRSYSDAMIETFNPLFPRGAYFGLAAFIGPSNLIDIHPSLTFDLSKKIRFVIDYDVFWRQQRNDGIYSPSVMLLYSGKDNDDLYIGQQWATNLDWDVSKFITARTEFTWFNAGEFLKYAGRGKDILFAGLTLTGKF